MSKYQMIIILALAIILLPFLGFSSDWDRIINISLGVLIILITYRLLPKDKTTELVEDGVEKSEDIPFVEHKNNNSI